MLENQTGNLFFDLLNGNVPLGSLQIGRGVAWSLLNLMMSIIALFNAIILLVTILTKKRKREFEEPDENDELDRNKPESIPQRFIRLKIPALLAGTIPGILFLILENIRLPVTWITRWTPIIGAFFIIHMALVIIQFAIKRKKKPEDPEDEGQEHELELNVEGTVVAEDLV